MRLGLSFRTTVNKCVHLLPLNRRPEPERGSNNRFLLSDWAYSQALSFGGSLAMLTGVAVIKSTVGGRG